MEPTRPAPRALRRAAPEVPRGPIPLVVLVGFLGAGKTTLLRQCLPGLAEQDVSTTVVLNDLLNANVDAATIADLVERVTPIGGACVCCDSSEALLRALVEAQRPRPDIVLVEANGTADAADLIEILVADRALSAHSLPIQVSVVDPTRWQRRRWNDGLEVEQVRSSSWLLLSRTEHVGLERRAAVERELSTVAPSAPIVDRDGLVEVLADLAADPARLPARRFDRPSGRHARDGHSAHRFSALEVALPESVDRMNLELWLRGLPASVVRAKGVARLAEGAWVYFSRTDHPGGTGLVEVPPRDLEPVAVLIGAGIDGERIPRLPAAC